MLGKVQAVRSSLRILTRILPLFSFAIPIILLYLAYPSSFEMTWKGRTFYLVFLWLISLETIVNWEKNAGERLFGKTKRTVFLVASLFLPSVYVVAVYFFGLKSAIARVVDVVGIPFAPITGQDWVYESWVLSLEYVVFAVLFMAIVWLVANRNGLSNFSTSLFFIGAVGAIYMIDTLYPYGHFAPFQLFVPPTAFLSSSLLNFLGYHTSLLESFDVQYGPMTSLSVWDPQHPLDKTSLSIAWPCSGVESLLLYTVTIWLFLKKTVIPWKQRIVIFAIGAAMTYLINVLRVTTIFLIAIGHGDWGRFHDFYGQLYSIIWIVSYPLIITGSRVLWRRIRTKKDGENSSLQSPGGNPEEDVL